MLKNIQEIVGIYISLQNIQGTLVNDTWKLMEMDERIKGRL